MLPYNYESAEKFLDRKDNSCLDISSIYQERKNVVRLIKATKNYD